MSGPYRDGDEVRRDRLSVLRDQREAIVARRHDLAVEQVDIEREIAAEAKRERDFYGEPVGEYVAVLLIAVGLMAAGLVAASALQPMCRKPRSMVAQTGAAVIRQAAELHLNTDEVSTTCPTLDGLVTARKVDRSKTHDPWGHPYDIACSGDDIHVWSAGRDGVRRTADDVGDHFKERDLIRIDALD